MTFVSFYTMVNYYTDPAVTLFQQTINPIQFPYSDFELTFYTFLAFNFMQYA